MLFTRGFIGISYGSINIRQQLINCQDATSRFLPGAPDDDARRQQRREIHCHVSLQFCSKIETTPHI